MARVTQTTEKAQLDPQFHPLYDRVQAPNARRADVSDAVINAIRDRSSSGRSEDRADIVSFAQQLATGSRVDNATFERLKDRHSVRWLVELTATAGHYGLITLTT